MFLYVIINADLYFERKLSFLERKWSIIDDVIENLKITKFHFFGQKLTFVNNVFLHLKSSNSYQYMSVLRIYGHLFCSYYTCFNIKSIQILALSPLICMLQKCIIAPEKCHFAVKYVQNFDMSEIQYCKWNKPNTSNIQNIADTSLT